MAFDLLGFAGVLVGIGLFISSIVLSIMWFFFWRKNSRAKLVTDGIHNYIRHPQHLPLFAIFVSFYMAIPTISNLVLLLFSFVFIHLSITRDESQLIRRYGQEYREYMNKVRWRLIPRVY
jgi:protein-S-isoprenylcysteine O-methyltransferase Ste14